MIELAPNHKYGLPIAAPVMPASGTFGYGEAYHDMVDLSLLGAIVTNPVSLRPRRVAHGQRIGVHADHFVVHTGWPSPGLRRVIREAGPVWERLPVPVIVHLLATRPVEVGRAAAYLSGVRGVRGVELGFTESVSLAEARDLLAATAEESDLPVIVKIPFSRVDDLASALAQAGADAITLMSPPRAVLPVAGGEAGEQVARFMRGRLYGAALLPLLLNALSRWAGKLGVPVIACGGIASPADALACLTLGAAAVQIDALLWRDPWLLDSVARALVQRLPHLDAENDDSPVDEGAMEVDL
ncbi:MAG: nitronate monooxygenase [Anaerolineae bacterium]|nr:nitronate monooxygenase [Anaerolineae bacterium]